MSPRTTVTVDGVVLTRAQVEQAMRELEKPVEPTSLELLESLQTGDHITFDGMSYLTYLVTDPIAGQRRLVADRGTSCGNTFAELAVCFAPSDIAIRRAGQ